MVNNVVMKIEIHISFWISVIIFFWCIPRSGIAVSYGSSIFNFLRNFHIVFQTGCTNLHFYLLLLFWWSCAACGILVSRPGIEPTPTAVEAQSLNHWTATRVPFFPQPRQHLLFAIFLVVAILISMTWYLTVVLICISMMFSDVEHLFMCLLAWNNRFSL